MSFHISKDDILFNLKEEFDLLISQAKKEKKLKGKLSDEKRKEIINLVKYIKKTKREGLKICF